MKKFQIVIPILNQHDATEENVQSWIDLAKDKIDILFIDNGSEVPLESTDFYRRWEDAGHVRCIRNDQNVGVYPTFQQGLENTDADFIFYSHNDVEMLEYGWDVKLGRLLGSSDSSWGVGGMFGAQGLGLPGIYQQPYHMHQLQRWGCVTVEGMHEPSSARAIRFEKERVMVLDGFSLIVSRAMIKTAMQGRFHYEDFPPHHMYDIDICITSHYAGFSNYCLDIDCIHKGGRTSTTEKWAEVMGTTDEEVHREAHHVFYEKWRGMLPVAVMPDGEPMTQQMIAGYWQSLIEAHSKRVR